MNKTERDHFLYHECEIPGESRSIDEYTAKIIKYLMLCDWSYSEEAATRLVEKAAGYIRKCHTENATVGDVAVNIGYCCG